MKLGGNIFHPLFLFFVLGLNNDYNKYFLYREDLSKLFVGIRGLSACSYSGSLVGIEGTQSLRRASSIRRTFTGGAAAIKRKSVCLQVKIFLAFQKENDLALTVF